MPTFDDDLGEKDEGNRVKGNTVALVSFEFPVVEEIATWLDLLELLFRLSVHLLQGFSLLWSGFIYEFRDYR